MTEMPKQETSWVFNRVQYDREIDALRAAVSHALAGSHTSIQNLVCNNASNLIPLLQRIADLETERLHGPHKRFEIVGHAISAIIEDDGIMHITADMPKDVTARSLTGVTINSLPFFYNRYDRITDKLHVRVSPAILPRFTGGIVINGASFKLVPDGR